MTTMMHAIRMSEFGTPDVLQTEKTVVPSPQRGEVLVRITAAGVCGRDVLYRQGTIGAATGHILGHEIAGVVIETGTDVNRFNIGDRVAATQRRSCHKCDFCTSGREVLCQDGVLYGDQVDGGYAEYCVIDEFSLAGIPDDVSDEAAAVAACGIGTGYHALRLAGMQGGETVLVTGASGGVGAHAMQIAKAMGCEVIAVTSSPGKTELLKGLADHVVLMEEGSFHRELKTRQLAPDIVLDLTAAYTLESSLRSTKRGGTVVIVGNIGPGTVEVLPGAFIMRESKLIGSKACSRRELDEVLTLVARGLVQPIIEGRYTLSQAPEVHRALEAKEITGRAVLVP